MIATGNEFVAKRLEISRAYRRVMFWVKVRMAAYIFFMLATTCLPMAGAFAISVDFGLAYIAGFMLCWWMHSGSKFLASKLEQANSRMIHEEMAKAIEQ